MMIQTEVLIIGGGFAGITAAKQLKKYGHSVLLVDRKSYFEVTFATLRNAVAPHALPHSPRKTYKSLIGELFLQGQVDKLTTNSAILNCGTKIKFDYAIIASGTRYDNLPLAKSITGLTLETRNQELKQYYQELADARKVMVVGGGVVGVELAGELASEFPNKSITLAHNKSTLLDGFKHKTQNKAYKQLTRIGVKVRLNSQYQFNGKDYIDKHNGHISDADYVLNAVGTQPNNAFLRPHLSHILDDYGMINVNQELGVVGEPSLFAIGDIANTGDAKLGYLAQKQGNYLAKTIVRKKQNLKIPPYKNNPFIALIPTGRFSGIVEHPFFVSTWRCLVNLKQKDLFITKVFNSLS